MKRWCERRRCEVYFGEGWHRGYRAHVLCARHLQGILAKAQLVHMEARSAILTDDRSPWQQLPRKETTATIGDANKGHGTERTVCSGCELCGQAPRQDHLVLSVVDALGIVPHRLRAADEATT